MVHGIGDEEMEVAYEFFTDESGRLVKDENNLFIIGQRHRCRVLCSGCGKPVIIDSGKLYDRPNHDELSAVSATKDKEALLMSQRKAHRCAKV